MIVTKPISGYMLGANLFRRLVLRVEADQLISAAIALNVLGCVMLAGATVALPQAWLAIVLPMVVIMVSVGMVIPACQLSVLQPYGAIAGTASGVVLLYPDVPDGREQLGHRDAVGRHLATPGDHDVSGQRIAGRRLAGLATKSRACGSGAAWVKRDQDQCMKIAIRMMTGIGTPRNQSSNERMLFSLINERSFQFRRTPRRHDDDRRRWQRNWQRRHRSTAQ